jgi:hypothetical protein
VADGPGEHLADQPDSAASKTVRSTGAEYSSGKGRLTMLSSSLLGRA